MCHLKILNPNSWETKNFSPTKRLLRVKHLNLNNYYYFCFNFQISFHITYTEWQRRSVDEKKLKASDDKCLMEEPNDFVC